MDKTARHSFGFAPKDVLRVDTFLKTMLCVSFSICTFTINHHFSQFKHLPCNMTSYYDCILTWNHKTSTLDPSSPPVFSGVRVTRSLFVCVCFVDRCLSFVIYFDIRILITPLVSSNSSCNFLVVSFRFGCVYFSV